MAESGLLLGLDAGNTVIKAVLFDRLARDEQGRWRSRGDTVTLACRSLLVAAGTSPNTIYEREHPGTFRLDARGSFFQACDADGAPDSAGKSPGSM